MGNEQSSDGKSDKNIKNERSSDDEKDNTAIEQSSKVIRKPKQQPA